MLLTRPGLPVHRLLRNETKNTCTPPAPFPAACQVSTKLLRSDFANGHDFETRELPCYLPGNGGLLSAVAMMAGGFMDGSAKPVDVGFPKGWGARSEGFKSYP